MMDPKTAIQLRRRFRQILQRRKDDPYRLIGKCFGNAAADALLNCMNKGWNQYQGYFMAQEKHLMGRANLLS